MTQKELQKALQKLKTDYPDIRKYKVEFYGSGDSFDDFYDTDIEFYPVVMGSINDITESINDEINYVLWAIIELTDADFNNSGCNGVITIDFEKETYDCEIQHYVTDTVPGEGATGDFGSMTLSSLL